jgi:hypothetical protein
MAAGPIYKERTNNLEVSVWKNEENGFHSVSIQKSFKNKQSGEWEQRRMSISSRDMTSLSELLDKAKSYLQGNNVEIAWPPREY